MNSASFVSKKQLLSVSSACLSDQKTGMLSPAFSSMSAVQWSSMPSDTKGVESLNKVSIDHSKRSKSLESCLEFTYRQDKKQH